MENLPLDIINYMVSFLQRTDQIAWKLTSKYFIKNFDRLMDLDSELALYTKTIEQLDYAWKGDSRYINIKEFPTEFGQNYQILRNYAEITELLNFDFNAQFDVFAGEYVIMFLTSVPDYVINIEFIDILGNIIKTTHKPYSNKTKINFNSKGTIKINCRENKKLKNLKTVQYIMCIPVYYWNKLESYKGTTAKWKKQIVFTNETFKYIRYFY